jgi:hypothetical protein
MRTDLPDRDSQNHDQSSLQNERCLKLAPGQSANEKLTTYSDDFRFARHPLKAENSPLYVQVYLIYYCP